jgi:hypothetical protein
MRLTSSNWSEEEPYPPRHAPDFDLASLRFPTEGHMFQQASLAGTTTNNRALSQSL